MASPQTQTGYKTVNSLAIEMSYHICEPIVQSVITPAISPGPQTVAVSSTIGMYVGAQLVIDYNNPATVEVVVVSAFTSSSFTATFANAHAAGALILTATFPTQAEAGDPFYTQSEILSYLARAQNTFLAKVPAIFQFSLQQVLAGEIFQSSPSNMIEINRIAYSPTALALSSLVRASNLVTATSLSPHNLAPGEKFSIFLADASFNGAFAVASILSPTIFTYKQFAANATAVAPGFAGLWIRLYERSQEELAMANPNWRNQYVQTLRSWFEDRAGNYMFGVAGKPVSNFPVELLCAIRDTNTLQLTDGLLVPDIMAHAIKYLALAWAWDKDSEQRNPKLSAYCLKRFDSIVLASQRWIDGVLNKV